MDATIYFGKIYIIEWLDPNDVRTGRELREMLEDLLPVVAPTVKLAFKRVASREEFLGYLRSIKDDFRATRLLPLLHVETHGNLYGIGLEGQEPLMWDEFLPELTALNQLTQLRLFFVLAACEGIWAMKMLQPTDRAAFLALLGPNDKISAGKLSGAMRLFYRTMFEKGSGDAAFKAINDSINPDKSTFSMVNAEMLFKMIWQSFLQDRTLPDELDKRVQKIVIQNMIAFREEHGFPIPPDVLAEVRRRVRRHVEAHEEHFAEFRKHFFFIDKFPGNNKRFPITFADLQQDGPS
jgi:hypothetical protein